MPGWLQGRSSLWRLQARPVFLRSLLPKAERRISQAIEPYSVHLRDPVITCAGWRDPLQMRAVNVQVLDRSSTDPHPSPLGHRPLFEAPLRHLDESGWCAENLGG